MRSGGPFGRYAAIVAVVVGSLIVVAWVAGQSGFTRATPGLDFAFGVVLGAVFGTGAGAYAVANGLSRQTEAAHTRLDAVHAPSEAVAQRLVDRDAAATAIYPPVEG